MTVAERIIDRLNAYEHEHADDPFGEGDANVWEDVIFRLAGKEIDEDATQAADPAYQSKVAVFKGGSAVRWLENERRWVVEVPE